MRPSGSRCRFWGLKEVINHPKRRTNECAGKIFDDCSRNKRAFLIALAFALPFTSQAQDKYLDDQGRVTTREQAEAANLPHSWRNIVSISPDGHWLICFRHYGSHWQENYLYRSDDGVRFVPAQKELDKKALEARRRYTSEFSNTSDFETAENFDTKAWDFVSAVEHIKVTKPVDVYSAEFVSWSSDSAKLLFSLTGRLNTTDNELTVDPYARNDREKPGVADWRAYYNMRTQQFELTDELRVTNKEARLRWSEGNDSANTGPPNGRGTNESINPLNEEIQTFIQAFVRDMASNDATSQMRYYNNPCRYYDQGNTSLPTVRKDIERDMTTWKKRSYSLHTQSAIKKIGTLEYTVTFEMAYTLEDPKPRSSGILAMSLRLKPDNGTFLITEIQKKVISARKR